MSNLVEIRNLSKRFDKDAPLALKQIHASFPKGKIIGLVGPDGAGKTTLIRLIAGLMLPSEGQITIAGLDTVTNADIISTMIGYMPQRFGLYEDLTVQQNLNLYADLKGVVGEERFETFQKLLIFTDLARFTDRKAKNLSGGMKQKLGLACALVKKPTLLLLDEPSVGVDPISRRELWKIVQTLVDEGITVLWSTSYQDEAIKCFSVLLLSEGRLLYHGDPQSFIKRVEGRTFKMSNLNGTRRSAAAQILQQQNVLDAVVLGNQVHFTLHDKSGSLQNLEKLAHDNQWTFAPDIPRFEDAFIDILGESPENRSILASYTPKIQSTKEIVVEAKHLTKQFGSFTAADDITFAVRSGEIFGLLGPNGAGKSTTFKMLCGLLKPTDGDAFVNGLDLQQAPSQARAQIGYMAQKFSLYGNLSVGQNLEFFSGIYNLVGKQKKEMIELMIKIFNLNPFLNKNADELPLGFKQRLALSCAVMHHPRILFLDEPTSGVDPMTRREFWLHINGLVDKGVTVVVTTHFMEEAEYCDRIGLIYRSKMIQMGTPEELKQLARTPVNPSPTLEDAFIELIARYGAPNHG